MRTHGLPLDLSHIVDSLLLHDTPDWLRRRSDKTSRRRFARPFDEAHTLKVWPQQGPVRAALAIRHLPLHAFGFPASRLYLAAAPQDAGAIEALANQIAAQGFDAEQQTFCEPHWNLRALVPTLQRAGFGIDGLSLAGDVLHALDMLPQRALPAEFTLRRGMPADHDTLISLRQSVFQHPNEPWRWYVGSPTELARKRARLAISDSRFWLLEQNGEIVGYIQTALNHHSFVGRSIAGLDVALTPAARGHGLLKVLMRTALEDLWKRGIYAYTGLSSRPEVLHVGTQLGRHPIRVAMRTGAKLTAQSFESTYPLD